MPRDKQLLLKLRKLKNFKPSKNTNKIFSELVNYGLNNKNKLTLSENELSEVQIISGLAECEMEKFWSNKIIKSKNPEKTLESFWYYENYKLITEMEYGSLCLCDFKNHTHQNFLFAGSGSLPLTGILLAKLFNSKVTLLDSDKSTIEQSKKLIDKLGLSKNFNYVHKDINDFNSYTNFDCIYIAALIQSNNKSELINKIYKLAKPGAHLLCRSAFGNRRLLYKPINLSGLNGLKPKLEIRPHNNVVNSFLIFQK